MNQLVKCPYCAELIPAHAYVCPVCGESLRARRQDNGNRNVIIGIVVAFAVAILTSISISLFSGGSDAKGDKPGWKKFIHPTQVGVLMYREAKESSAVLNLMSEEEFTDASEVYWGWSDEVPRSGFEQEDWAASPEFVYPVIDENDEWYKIYVSDEYIGTVEVYVKKNLCEEVMPEPVTKEVLNRVQKTMMRRDNLITTGKYKNTCISSYMGAFEEIMLKVGTLEDGVLIYKEQDQAIMEMPKFTIGGVDLYDTRALSDEQIAEIVAKNDTKINGYKDVYYYFPTVHRDELISFYIPEK